MRYVLLLIAALPSAVPALAEEYERGANGGPVLDVAGINAELLTADKMVTINVFDAKNHTPIATKGYTAAMLIAGGNGRETVTLTQSGVNALKGEAKTSIAAGMTITLTLETDEGKSGQAKFKK